MSLVTTHCICRPTYAHIRTPDHYLCSILISFLGELADRTYPQNYLCGFMHGITYSFPYLMLNVIALLGHTKRERYRQVRVGSRCRPRRWSLSERSGKLGQRPKLPGQLSSRDSCARHLFYYATLEQRRLQEGRLIIMGPMFFYVTIFCVQCNAGKQSPLRSRC